MIDQFTYKIYLPSLKQYTRVGLLSNQKYVDIVKYIQNDDDYVVKYFDWIIDTLHVDGPGIDQMDRVDKFCVLLNLRILCVSDKMELIYTITKEENTNKQNIKVNLYDVLDAVVNHEVDYTKWYKLDDECSIRIQLDNNLLPDKNKQWLDMISGLRLYDTEYDLNTIKRKDYQILLDQLPSRVVTKITKYIKELNDKYVIEAVKLNHVPGFEQVDNVNLRLFDDSFLAYLKLSYNTNLKDIYYTHYLLNKHMGFSMGDLESKTPQDTNTYITMFRKELDDKKKAQEKASKPAGSISLPGQSFVQ